MVDDLVRKRMEWATDQHAKCLVIIADQKAEIERLLQKIDFSNDTYAGGLQNGKKIATAKCVAIVKRHDISPKYRVEMMIAEMEAGDD